VKIFTVTLTHILLAQFFGNRCFVEVVNEIKDGTSCYREESAEAEPSK
jgi:hypothetical protein